MPRPAPLLAALLVVSVLVASVGCIEQRDPPEHGEFTIEVDTSPLLFTGTLGERLHGAHAHVETDLHHEHPDYYWEIEDIGRLEGSDVQLPAMDEGLYPATYELEYYEQEEGMPLLIAALGPRNASYAVIAESGVFEDPTGHEPGPFTIASAENLTLVEPNGPIWKNQWALLRGEVDRTQRMGIDVELDPAAEEAEYVVGFQWVAGLLVNRWSTALVIHPGEVHNLKYLGPGALNITIAHQDDPGNATFEGGYDELPDEYRGHLGTLHWQGEVGEGEEAPGLGFVSAVAALSVVAVSARRCRR